MRDRKINIELIRVFAIFMTVLIHVSNLYISRFPQLSKADFLISVTYNCFSRICVPLFFMISGIFLLHRQYDRRKYFSRILKFLVLLIAWSIIYRLYNNDLHLNALFPEILGSVLNADRSSRHLWYLYAAIGIYIALPFIQAMCRNLTTELENLFLLLWFCLSGIAPLFIPLISAVIKAPFDLTYPIPIINSTYYLGYFISGHIIYERLNSGNSKSPKAVYCILGYLLTSATASLITYLVSVGTGSYFDCLTWYRNAFVIIAAFSVFVLVIIKKDRIKSEFIPRLSKYTLGIYLIHMLPLNALTDKTDILKLSPYIGIPLMAAAAYLSSLLLCFILSKIPFVKRLVM